MASDQVHTPLIEQVLEEERKCNWSAAAQACEKLAEKAVAGGQHKDAAEVRNRMGYCLYRSSFQTKSRSVFLRAMHRSSEAYLRASRLFGLIGAKGAAYKHHSEGLATLSKSYSATDPRGKLSLLRSSGIKLRRAASEFHREKDATGLALAYKGLLTCLWDQLKLEWRKGERLRILNEALDVGRKAILLFSRQKNNLELSWSLYYVGLHAGYACVLFDDPLERESLRRKSVSYFKRALALAKRLGDDLLCSKASKLVPWRIGFTRIERIEEFESFFHDAFEYASRTGDSSAIADAEVTLAYNLVWKMAAEEDPVERRRHFERCQRLANEAIAKYEATLSDIGISEAYAWGLCDALYFFASGEVDPSKSKSLVERAVIYGRMALKHFRRAQAVSIFGLPTRPVTRSLYSLALLENNPDRRRSLLEEALTLNFETFRFTENVQPYHYWDRGVAHQYPGLVQAEMSELVRSYDEKLKLLKGAATNLSKALENCKMHFPSIEEIPAHACSILGSFASDLGSVLQDLHRLVKSERAQADAVRALRESVDFYMRAGWPSRAAEGHWKIAKILDGTGDFSTAAKELGYAAQLYKLAAVKIPQLKDFYQDYSSYMAAWTEIEIARHHLMNEDYAASAGNYAKASQILRETRRWSHISDYHSSNSVLQHAEDLSRQEKFHDSMNAFKDAAELFRRSADEIKREVAEAKTPEERAEMENLAGASTLKGAYCLARMALENAQLLDKSGDKTGSARYYSEAGGMFSEISKHEQAIEEASEIQAMPHFCEAWSLMKRAESELNPDLYLEASRSFTRAKETSKRKKTSLLSLANGYVCKSMHFEWKFRESGKTHLFSKAKIELERAAELYSNAGFDGAALWTRATSKMFDARGYIVRAQVEVMPGERVKLYSLAEKCIESAAALYSQAGKDAEKEEALKDLQSVREERRLASSLEEMLRTNPAVSSTAVISPPASTIEKPSGLEEFETSNIQAQLLVQPRAEEGEPFEAYLHLANAGKAPAKLLKIEQAIPAGCSVVSSPFAIQDSSIDLAGRLLEPLRLESIKLSFLASQAADLTLAPHIVYTDSQGKLKALPMEAVSIKIAPKTAFEFKSETERKIFDYLVESFIDDYMRRRLYFEQAGWRSLTHIAGGAKVSKASLYGAERRYSPAMSELVKRGLIETRIFTGERGRGGEVIKARVSYDREAVKRHVERVVARV